MAEAYAHRPLSFESNRGQVDEQVLFLARGSQADLFLTRTEFVLLVRGQSDPSGLQVPPAVVRLRPVDANPCPDVAGLGESLGVSHYYIGSDAAGWLADVPQHGRIRYSDVYPGIDVVHYGHQGLLEHDFIVAPGANPEFIGLQLIGAEHAFVDDHGDIVVLTSAGDVRLRNPLAYQDLAGARTTVPARWVLTESGADAPTARFELAAFDRTRPLVIDPVLDYATFLGGNGLDSVSDIAVTTVGAVYVTGYTASTGFPGGDPMQVPSGGRDVFVTRLNAAGIPTFCTYIGGTADDVGESLALFPPGARPTEVLVAGITASVVGFPQLAALQAGFGGGTSDGFVARLQSNGVLASSTYLGGDGDDAALAIVPGPPGHAYVTGFTSSTDFEGAGSVYGSTLSGPRDAFVSHVTFGSSIVSSYLGGSNIEDGLDLYLTPFGGVFVTGQTCSADFSEFLELPETAGVNTGVACDAFVSLLPDTLGALSFSTHLGGSAWDRGTAIIVDAAGAIFVAGETTSTDFPGISGSSIQGAYGGGFLDAFVAEIDIFTSSIAHATFFGGTDGDAAADLALDANGRLHVTGTTWSSDLPGAGASLIQPLFGGGATDAFVAEFDFAAGSLVHSTYLGGTGADLGSSIALDAFGQARVGGGSDSLAGFPVTALSAFQADNAGAGDGFVARLVEGPASTCAYVSSFSDDSVALLDTSVNVVLSAVGVSRPWGVAVTPNAARVYVTSRDATTRGVAVIDVGTGVRIDTDPSTPNSVDDIEVVDLVYSVAASADGKWVYVSTGVGFVTTLLVIDADPSSSSYNTVVAEATAEVGPRGLAVSPDGTRVYLAQEINDSLAVFDTSDPTNPVHLVSIETFPDMQPLPIGQGRELQGVAVSPDGAWVYVTNRTDGNITIFDTSDQDNPFAARMVATGTHPLGIAVSPDGTRVYVANEADDNLAIVDTSDPSNATLLTTVAVGDVPHGVAVTPDGRFVYVANLNSDSLSVVDMSDPNLPVVLPTTIPVAAPVALGKFICPTSARENGRALLGNAGGAVSTGTPSPTDTVDATVTIPAGALASDTPISVSEFDADDPVFPAPPQNSLSSVFRFSLEGLHFDAPITITFSYDDAEVAGLDESTLNVNLLVDGEYITVADCATTAPPDPDPCVSDRDLAANTITVTTTHFTTYGLSAALGAVLEPLAPQPPSSASSGCAPPSVRLFRVACNLPTDDCMPPPGLETTLIALNHGVPSRGECLESWESIPVTCDEVVELRLLAPACPAKPRSAHSALGLTPLGMKVVSAEAITLEARTEARCGPVRVTLHDPTRAPAAPCEEAVADGTCCALLAPPAPGRCKLPRCQ